MAPADELSEHPAGVAETATLGSSEGASRYSPSSITRSGTDGASGYSAAKSYFADHLLLEIVSTLEVAVRSTLAPFAFHSRWFIA